MSSITEIKIKMRSLLSKAPFSKELKELKRKLDIVDFAFSNLNLDGSIITRAGVMSILEGNVIDNAPVKEHRLIELHNKLLFRMEDRIEMKMEVDISIIEDLYKIICDNSSIAYRTGNPILYHLDFVPDEYTHVRQALIDSIKQVDRRDFAGDFCLKAAAYHLEIIKAYPFDTYSEMLARTILQYELIRSGLFTLPINIGEQKYNSIISESLITGNPEGFAQVIRDSALAKLDFLLDKA